MYFKEHTALCLYSLHRKELHKRMLFYLDLDCGGLNENVHQM